MAFAHHRGDIGAGQLADGPSGTRCLPCLHRGTGLLPDVAHVLVWNCPWITSPTPEVSAESIARLNRLIEQARPDAAVILTSFHQSPLPLALLLRLAGVKNITGASSDFAGTLLDNRLRPGEDFTEDQPEPLRARRIAAAAGRTGW